MEEKKSRRSYQESAGLRAGRREEKKPGQQIPEQLLPPPGQEPRGQAPPQMEGTTKGAIANPSKGAAGRGPGCNMESPTRGTKEEGAHTAWAGLPVARTPQAGGEDGPGSRGALAGVGAKENYPATTTPRGTGGEVTG